MTLPFGSGCATMNTTLTLNAATGWVRLQGVENGVLIQILNGSVVYYAYSATKPLVLTGYELAPSPNPIPLFGGSIWVRAKGSAHITYSPAAIGNNTPYGLIGQLADLHTLNKTTLVEAINETYDRIGIGGGGGGSPVYSGEYTLTDVDISAKQFQLPYLPDPASLKLEVFGGCLQRRNVDYWVDGNIVKWTGLALESLVDSGSVLSLFFIRG